MDTNLNNVKLEMIRNIANCTNADQLYLVLTGCKQFIKQNTSTETIIYASDWIKKQDFVEDVINIANTDEQ